MRKDPKSTKKTDNLTVFFVLLGSARVKALNRMLVKSTLSVFYFTNILQAALLATIPNVQKRQSSHRCLFIGKVDISPGTPIF
jgi:hypothetical protein